MAFIYPFASLFVVWMATGQNTCGITELFPENSSLWSRALALAIMCPAAFFAYRLNKNPNWRNGVFYLVAFAGAGAGAVAGVVIFAFAFAVANAVAITGAGAVAAAFPFAFAVAFASTGASAVAVAAAAAGAGAVLFFEEFMSRRGLKGLFYWLYIPFMLGGLAFVCSRPAWFPPPIEAFEFSLIFLVLLPLINSIFDWLSLASTRWLLNGMAARHYASAFLVAGNAIAGLGLGMLLLAGLAVTITAALQTINLLSEGNGGPELFDPAGTLHRLRRTPADVSVWWVYFTLFSTMLPTVFHATVASASFVTWRLPDSWKKHWLGLIAPGKDTKDDHPLLVGMSWRLTAIDVLTVILVALATAALAWLLFWLMPHEGRGLLWLCEKVAEWLGAPITV